jgi:hypothetical protein
VALAARAKHERASDQHDGVAGGLGSPPVDQVEPRGGAQGVGLRKPQPHVASKLDFVSAGKQRRRGDRRAADRHRAKRLHHIRLAHPANLGVTARQVPQDRHIDRGVGHGLAQLNLVFQQNEEAAYAVHPQHHPVAGHCAHWDFTWRLEHRIADCWA